MKILNLIFLSAIIYSGNVFSTPILDEEKVTAIGEEFEQAMKDKDFSIFEKYIYEGSKITIDMDPDNSRGEKEISYDAYLKMTKMSLGMMGDAEIHDEVLSISVDKEKNEATIEAKTTAIIEMMGIKIEDISINQTTYGIVNGEIKVLVSSDQLISSGPID